MAISGAKGNIAQIKQMAGMRGLMSNPRGRIIDLPIKSSFREGLSVLEYFISTHGARKGLAGHGAPHGGTAATSPAGLSTYPRRSLFWNMTAAPPWASPIQELPDKPLVAPYAERLLGRVVINPVADPTTGEIIVDRDEQIMEEQSRNIASLGISEVFVRSPLNCEARSGICSLCYGRNPATGRLAILGEAGGSHGRTEHRVSRARS